jgi:thermosome
MGGQPVYILSEGAQRFLGRDARRMNIMAAKVVAEAVKSTLGPRGMDKMLVDSTGDVVITNDGAAILKEVEIKHPAAKMMAEIAKTVEKEAGDGTTSAVVLAGELLKRAENLLDQEVHATVIARGYRMAEEESMRIVEKISKEIKPTDEASLRKVALTALYSKAPGITAKDHLAKLSTEAVKLVGEKTDGRLVIDKSDVKIQKQVGASTRESEIINGVVIDKERAHPGMPKVVEGAKIALLNIELKVKKTETDAKFDISTPEQLQSFLDEEEETIRRMVKSIVDSGANCVICQKDIDDLAQYFLAKEGILAVKSVDGKDVKLIAKASGAKVVTNLKEMTEADLGKAQRVEERKIGGKEFVFIEGCEFPKAVTLFVRGGTEHVVDEAERSLDDAISVVRDVMEDGRIVAGGGASMMEISRRLREFANTVGGREQLAVIEFAEAMETIPRTLAENAGLDPIDTIISLRAQHEKGRITAGINLVTGKPADMLKMGIMEPVKVREQVIKSATETAIMILRIDDVIAAKGALTAEEEKEEKAPPTPPAGMPSY